MAQTRGEGEPQIDAVRSFATGQFVIRTIPSSDGGFAASVSVLARRRPFESARELEATLRRLYPRVVVRDRLLAGESRPTLYVYRDGGWAPPATRAWWSDPSVASLTLDAAGFLAEANEAAVEILGLDPKRVGHRHATDFLVPGTLTEAEARQLLSLRTQSNVVARILDGRRRVREVELHTIPTANGLDVYIRPLDRQQAPEAHPRDVAVALRCAPAEDEAFARLARELLAWMSEPSPEGLELRLRRIYPRASVLGLSDAEWELRRDTAPDERLPEGWWRDESLPRVAWDDDGLIVDANEAARAYLGEPALIGRNWRQVAGDGGEEGERFRHVLHELGAAESTWRLTGADGLPREYAHRTELRGEVFVTIMRPRE